MFVPNTGSQASPEDQRRTFLSHNQPVNKSRSRNHRPGASKFWTTDWSSLDLLAIPPKDREIRVSTRCQVRCICEHQLLFTTTLREKYHLQFANEENRHCQDPIYSEMIQGIHLENCYQWAGTGEGTGQRREPKSGDIWPKPPNPFMATGITVNLKHLKLRSILVYCLCFFHGSLIRESLLSK